MIHFRFAVLLLLIAANAISVMGGNASCQEVSQPPAFAPSVLVTDGYIDDSDKTYRYAAKGRSASFQANENRDGLDIRSWSKGPADAIHWVARFQQDDSQDSTYRYIQCTGGPEQGATSIRIDIKTLRMIELRLVER
jgi:hypothetical protein